MTLKKEHVGMGMLGSLALLGFYFLVTSLLGGWNFAVENFQQYWQWMVPLIIGFGVQIGLFFYVKAELHRRSATAAAASTGMSTGAMVACCVHHIADIAPFLGIAAAGLFFTKYQASFLLMGVMSNILGIAYLGGMLITRISSTAKTTIFFLLIALSIFVVGVSFVSPATKAAPTSFETQSSVENGIEFIVSSLSASEFRITINTHSGSLDFEMTEVSMLKDDRGNTYAPLRWDGSAPGGHHRSGTLYFEQVDKNARQIFLTTNGREFSWNLK
jgi:hypothetical protein